MLSEIVGLIIAHGQRGIGIHEQHTSLHAIVPSGELMFCLLVLDMSIDFYN